MKILIIYPTNVQVDYQYGIASISAVLKKNGHKVVLVRLNKEVSKRFILDLVEKINPDLVAFSFVSNYWYYVKKYSEYIKKKYSLPIVVGGIHATTHSEEVIAHPYIDVVCVGEGEYPMLDLVNAIEQKKDYTHIKNLWVKKNGKIIKNPLRPLVENLDELPNPDRELFYGKSGTIAELYVAAGRGCPYDCTYCCNHLLRKIYTGLGKYLRMRSVDKLIAEIKENQKKYKFQNIAFSDDTFTMFKDWLKEFSEKYKKEINVPFTCNARVETINEDVLKMLKHAGCTSIAMGIESGSEELRTSVLKRRMSNKQIIDTFKLTKKYGMAASTYYMIGFPCETTKMIEDTLKVHKAAKPNGGFQLTVFYPYPGTDLYTMCEKEKYLTGKRKDTFVAGFFGSGGYSTLKLPTLSEKEIKKYYWKFLDLQYKEHDFGFKWVKKHHGKIIYAVYRFISLFVGPSKAFMFMLSFKRYLIPKAYVSEY